MKTIKSFENFINEELSPETIKSALGKTREYDQYNRGYKIGQNFYNEFVGKPLFGGTIIEVGTGNHRSSDFYVIITVERERSEVSPNGTRRAPEKLQIYYDVERDSFDDTLPGEPTRSDARILSQVAKKINPETKYGNINTGFNVKY